MSEYVGSGANVHINAAQPDGSVDSYFVRTNATKPRVVDSQPWSGLTLKDPFTITNENWLVKHLDDGGLHISRDGFNPITAVEPTNKPVVQADAAILEGTGGADDRLFTAGIYGTNELYISYTDTAGNQEGVLVPVNATNDDGMVDIVSLSGVALTVDEDRMIVAVTGTAFSEGFLGWMVMGLGD
jgi:hypothetical protein